MARKILNKKVFAILTALLLCFNCMAISVAAARNNSTSSSKTVYLMYSPGTQGSATVTVNGAQWTGGLDVSSSPVTAVITPATGYRVVSVDVLCTGGGNRENPLDCRTYNEGQSYSASANPGEVTVTLSNFSSSDCNHSSGSTVYYLMITLEEVEIEKTYQVTYLAGDGIGSAYTDNNNGQGYTFSTAYSVLDVTDSNIGYINPGYDFAGWLVTSCSDTNAFYNILGNTYQAGGTFAFPSSDVTLTAQWTKQVVPKYVVSYEYAGDIPESAPTLPNLAEYEADTLVTVASTPEAIEGYSFTGWETTDVTVENGGFEMPEKAVTFVGTWAKLPTHSYTVTYNANFGDNPATATDAENVNGTYATSHSVSVDGNTFDREGYRFVRWEDANGTAYAENQTITLTAENNSKVLYAVWELIPTYDYTLTYDANYGDSPATATDAESITGTVATNVELTVDGNMFTREGYRFLYWEDANGNRFNPDGKVALTSQNNTKVLYAVWELIPTYDYKVIYHSNFDTDVTAQDGENIENTTDNTHVITVDANIFTRENYTFAGWATEADSAVSVASGDEITFTESKTVHLYAKWTENTKYNYTVIYNGNGGALDNGELTYGDAENIENSYLLAHSIEVDANSFKLANNHFVGWNTQADGNGEFILTASLVDLTAENNTVTLYAIWQENPKFDYTVIYNANFGEDPSISIDTDSVEDSYLTTHNVGIDANMFAREGYSFLHWEDKNGNVYAEGTRLVMTARNSTLTLYAIWEKNIEVVYNDFILTYNANFGTNPATALDSESVFHTPLSSVWINVDNNSFVREGYTFVGWNTRPDGLGIDYNPNDAIVLDTSDNTCELFAIWVKDTAHVPHDSEDPIPEDPENDDEPEDGVEPYELDEEELTELEDEEVPLADVPVTADPILYLLATALVSGIGLIAFGKKKA